MATINNLPQIEGIRDFFRGEIYGEVSKLLETKGFFGNHDNPLYIESLDILCEANRLVDIIFDDGISPDAKNTLIEASVQNLHRRLATLKEKLMH